MNMMQKPRPLREEHRLMVFENGMLRRIFGYKRGEVLECHENVMRSFITSTVHKILLG
jgi:hypothetical protein